MAAYRLYQLEKNHIVAASDFEATNDEAALIYARSHIHFESIEIWCGARKVGAFAGPAPQTAAS